MNTTDASLDARIRTFADAVRAHFDDLPADEVDDIVIGLTADLAEQAADNDGLLELGDPAAYAQELRTAAGLPDRTQRARREPLRARVTAQSRALVAGIRRSTFGAWLLDLLVALRPVWWMLRGFGLYAVVAVLFGLAFSGGDGWIVPNSIPEWVLLLAIVLVSVQWGRGRWLPRGALRHLRTAASILAVIALPFALASALTPRVEWVYDESYPQPGLLLDGEQVGNLFAYDDEGELIDSVQLYTDKGTPLNLFGDGDTEYGWRDDDLVTVPFRDSRGQSIWNIYPLQEAPLNSDTGEVRESRARAATPPFVRAPGLRTPAPIPSPSPTPGATDAADDGADDGGTPAP